MKQLVGLSVSVNELLKVEKPAFHYGFSLNKLFAINKPHLSAYLIRLRVTPGGSVCSFCIIFSYPMRDVKNALTATKLNK